MISMLLTKLLNLQKGDIVSIIGAGGKTSLMFALAQELRKDYKVLVTTTTKIFVPEKHQYDFMAIGMENLKNISCSSSNGIYVFGDSVSEEGKIVAIDKEILDTQRPFFDFILYEADGSKCKPIKGWNKSEPVISIKTTKTIGVLSIESIGKVINDDNVHRVNEFLNITDAKENEIITMENMLSVIFHPDGLFKCSNGEKILFINKVDNYEQKVLANELMYNIRIKNREYKLLDKVIYGSLKNRKYLQY